MFAKLKAYYALTKPKVLFLMVTTSWVGMLLAPGPHPSWLQVCAVSLGIFCCAGSGAVLNQVWDRQIDAQMQRTAGRPLVTQQVSLREGVIWALLLMLVGSMLLLTYGTWLCWILTLSGALGYSLIYTRILKYASPQNIVIGGIYGALPPLLGWTAVTGRLGADALLLVAIIFTWTPVHFWALALDRVEDYQAANVPMLPVTHGHRFTSISILLYNLLLFPVCALPYVTGFFSWRYACVSLVLNSFYFFLNLNVLKRIQRANKTSFIYSIGYLYLLFITMLIDKGI